MHGGVKFYRGSAAAARCYVEADRARADDYYLAEGSGLAEQFVATRSLDTGLVQVQAAGSLDGGAYERWVAGLDPRTAQPKGRLRRDAHGLRFVEVVVNGPKTWSLAAAVHPELAAAYDAAQERAAGEVIGWLAENATTRVGPMGRQVQVPVERIEAAIIRHHTSRSSDPHRHLHLQINARVFAVGQWRGLHSVGVVDSIKAINGIGYAAMACDPEFRQVIADLGYHLDPRSGDIKELAPYAPRFSARSAQIGRNVDRYEAHWRSEHPGEEPGRRLQWSWERRAWADGRPDKVAPRDGVELVRRWVEQLTELGFTPPDPTTIASRPEIAAGRINRDAVVDIALSRLAIRRSAWNAADIRGEVERIVASVDLVADPSVRRELAEDLTARAVDSCVTLLDRVDVPGHVRALTSQRVLDVEADLVDRLVQKAGMPPLDMGTTTVQPETGQALQRLDGQQRQVVGAISGVSGLVVVEGAAGAGKTSTLAAAGMLLAQDGRRMFIVTPTLKAAQVAQAETGAQSCTAAWLVHQHGFRWNDDGFWTRVQAEPPPEATFKAGDTLVVDEAGMLDQDTALALLSIVRNRHVTLVLVGDRHQLPAVGRGGVLDHAARWARPDCRLTLESARRFRDPAYAEATLLMRTGHFPGQVFDTLHDQGHIEVHASEVERRMALTEAGLAGHTVIADTHGQVDELNATIRDRRLEQVGHPGHPPSTPSVTTAAGVTITPGDQVSTRRNDPEIGVANRDRWVVTAITGNGDVTVQGRRGTRTLPPSYVDRCLELAYATTVYGAQGETVNQADLLISETTGAAAAYVGMTRGRHLNTAHLVAPSVEEARSQWIRVFSRDRTDLGPAHARRLAVEEIERFGLAAQTPRPQTTPHSPMSGGQRHRPSGTGVSAPPTHNHGPSPGVGR